MYSETLRASGERGFASRLLDVPNWVWWLLVLVYIGVRSWGVAGVGVYGTYGDPDDATRLIQVRELMASWNWFDTTTMKLGGDAGMLSHWSRLIDLPIAILIATFNLFMPVADAERLVHTVWPLSLLAALLWMLFKTTSHVGGKAAGRLVLLLAALTPLGWYQFAVGRIDHHNAMMATIIGATTLMWAYPQRADIWRVAGVLAGLALAVGYEALAPAVGLGIFATAWALFDRRVEKSAAAFAVALALVFAAAFVGTIPPSRWMDIRCDAISLNMVALVTCGVGGLLVAVGPGRDWTIGRRIASIAAFAAVGIVIFGALEPKCLAGPKGQLPALVLDIWLNKVAENASFIEQLFQRKFGQPLVLLLLYGIALSSQVYQVRASRSASDLFLLAMLGSLIGLACWQYKYTAYACFLSIVPMAVVFSRLGTVGEIGATTVRLGAVILLNQTTLTTLSTSINGMFGAPEISTEETRTDVLACSKPGSIRDLAALPAGLVAAHINVGPFIAANTHHRALAAPYHRIANAIIANYEIFSAHDQKSAAAVLKQENVDYVAICDGLDAPDAKDPKWTGTLKADLIDGKAPGFLVPQTLPNPHSIYHVWKVDRAALNLQLSKAAASGS
ncbi:hypothetical protein [Hyphomicrobium sp.]|jgi:hypothetical protein|uniref:hypothetical protein n=1 Tax=Hyphomicrobium sp. TaxID=82 RepID=UPI0035637145